MIVEVQSQKIIIVIAQDILNWVRKMECPKCGGIMIYNKQRDKLFCLNCFYERLPNDRKCKTVLHFRVNDE